MKTNKTQIARHLRQQQTAAEERLWGLLRKRQFENLKFRRQQPLKDYIVDFYCYELKLVIELDGGYHDAPEQKYKDEQRDIHLKVLGYKVLRFKNEMVFDNISFLYQSIKEIKELTPSQREREKSLLSTKRLSPSQKEIFSNVGLSLVECDAITIELFDFEVPETIENAIFTSQNGVNSYLQGKTHSGTIKNCYCVGEKTKMLLDENGQKVIKTAQNASELAQFIIKNYENRPFYYFCGSKRRDELPNLLKTAKIELFEIKTYKTTLKPKYFDQKWAGILFFSPSGIESFLMENTMGAATAFCIGETTASEARKHTRKVMVADNSTVESVIDKAVNILKGDNKA
jgi:uroporphyrinogen-III synthase